MSSATLHNYPYEQASKSVVHRFRSNALSSGTENIKSQLSSNGSFSESEQAAVDSNKHDQRFSHLLEIMPAGVLVIDQQGKVSLANQQAIALFGNDPSGALWRDVISQSFAPREDDGHEVSMRNGKRVKIDMSPLTLEKGQLIVITDLTQTRQLQTRVSHMQRLSSLGRMVASLAHQVRTPLSSALLYAENLKSMPLQNEMASRFSEKLTLRLKELESQVNDMLLFAKSSDKQIVSALETEYLENILCSQLDAQMERENIELNCHNAVASKKIIANETAIVGAIGNLINNAMQALIDAKTPNPKIDLMIDQVSVNEQAYIAFVVRDNGNGLPANAAAEIFEPFYTTKSQGTGLGLAVVQTVAKSHKGLVKCGNNQHKGAYFALYIPLHEQKKQMTSEQANEVSLAATGVN